MKPMLSAKHLNISITLEELYQFSKIDLHLFSCDINNNLEIIDISHTSHPDMELCYAMAMTSAIPGAVRPIFYEDGCYIDGGATCPYPLFFCKDKYPSEDDILGITHANCDGNMAIKCSKDDTTLEYLINLAQLSIKYIAFKTITDITTKYTIKIPNNINTMSIDTMKRAATSSEFRKELISTGLEYEIIF